MMRRSKVACYPSAAGTADIALAWQSSARCAVQSAATVRYITWVIERATWSRLRSLSAATQMRPESTP